MSREVHIPYLSEDEKIFLNTAATFSQARRMSTTLVDNQHSLTRPPSIENSNNRRHQVVSVSSLSFLWKRRGSSSSSVTTTSSAGSFDHTMSVEEDYLIQQQSPKAKELESLIFEQPQRTVRLSLTPHCAI
ncbi:uncharacterized protein BX663DRAFT_500217 [Cokeromyces recurvatus]|uniref:uncharacterized protein n=1 Tax=Cokeromyces recurvatus TaxID=90255 RepID=UPI0022205C1F|nr:uncharacterized protein BX663DRAFT_500217 [Cokeromyces recurvatus]KAI7905580.1 hypothetical protein BX663DRAFT_500217 [Cokeromyces recurvatus]